MTYLKTIVEAIPAISASKGIAMYDEGLPEIKDGVLGEFIFNTEYEDEDGGVRHSKARRVGLLYPGIAGSISILGLDNDTGSVFLTDVREMTLSMNESVDLEEYVDVFNRTSTYAGPDTEVRLVQLIEFKL